MKSGVQILNYNSEKEDLKTRAENVKLIQPGNGVTSRVTCNGMDGASAINIIPVYWTWNGDYCSSNGYATYTVENMSIKLIFPSGTTLLTTTNIPVQVKYGTTTLNSTANVQSSHNSLYTLSVENFLFNDYCSVSTVDVVCTVEVKCSDESITSGDLVTTVDIAANRNDICQSISPAFFQPDIGGNGTVGLSGYIPCSNPAYNPCIVYANAVDFWFRKVGSTSWTTYVLSPYLYGAWQVSGLSSGNYQWMHRNIKYVTGTTNISCYGIFSDTNTVYIH